MAERPVFIPQAGDGTELVREQPVSFEWFPGLAPTQKQKSIDSLHQAAIAARLCRRPLEVSTKSPNPLGQRLSAFNLRGINSETGARFTVETAFQSSKVFTGGGPFRDLLYGTSLDAKRDERLRSSGPLTYFVYGGVRWDLEPRTAFYDWLYIRALRANEEMVDELRGYDAFTDIEFNPARSINCQARSVALFLALQSRNLLSEAIASKDNFLEVAELRDPNQLPL